jgi:hypothetical protein
MIGKFLGVVFQSAALCGLCLAHENANWSKAEQAVKQNGERQEK